MPVAKIKASNTTDLMKEEEGNDSLDTIIRQAIGKEPLISFPRTGDNPVQWIQLLHALDQQDIPGWPLLSPLKVQMQKCDKCSREFCSSINYRRHIRVHHRLKKLDKDSTRNRDLLGAFWDKLADDVAKEILSLKDVMLEEVPGSSIIKSLTALVRRPGFSSLPQYCLRAGSTLLDMIQAKPSRFPLSSEQLFGILDDASEKTFLCGTAVSMQKYIFDGEAGKIGLETKNLVACTSFLVEQKLVKAWLADKDAEALRCQKLLVEEEEAAQRRQAALLERKRQKKLRQREQKAKEHIQEEKVDLMERIEDMQEAEPLAEQSCTFTRTDFDMHGPESLPELVSSSCEPFQFPNTSEYADLEIQTGSGSRYVDLGTGHFVERQMVQGNSGRHTVVARRHIPPRNHLPNGFHGSQNLQAPKKHGAHRDSKSVPMVNGSRKWSRKLKPDHNGDSQKTSVQKEAISQTDQSKKRAVLIGSISVTLGNCSHHEGNNLDGSEDDYLTEHQLTKKNGVRELYNRHDSVQCGANQTTLKLWRPVSRNVTILPIVVENGSRESPLDGTAGEGEDQTLSQDSCLVLCAMDDNHNQAGNSSPVVESPRPGILQFSSQEAKAFLAERWKEAIASEHVKLVLSPDLELPEDMEVEAPTTRSSDVKECSVLSNSENQLVDAGAHETSTMGPHKAKFRTKLEKGAKLKYIPKRRPVT